jgi:hypothetical protein
MARLLIDVDPPARPGAVVSGSLAGKREIDA